MPLTREEARELVQTLLSGKMSEHDMLEMIADRAALMSEELGSDVTPVERAFSSVTAVLAMQITDAVLSGIKAPEFARMIARPLSLSLTAALMPAYAGAFRLAIAATPLLEGEEFELPTITPEMVDKFEAIADIQQTLGMDRAAASAKEAAARATAKAAETPVEPRIDGDFLRHLREAEERAPEDQSETG